MKYRLLLFILLIGTAAFAQEHQKKYLAGKELMRSGKYRLAMETFRSVADPQDRNEFTEYASYYYAISAYRDGQVYVARDMFRQIASQFSRWQKMDEVNLWLTQIYLEIGNFETAFDYFDRIVSNEAVEQGRSLKRYHLMSADSVELLTSLQEQYPRDRDIAEALVVAIQNQPMGDKDIGLLESLVNEFNLDRERYNVLDYSQNIKKEEYNVAVVLPFMFNGFDDTRTILRNNLVMSLYQGMLIAAQELEGQGPTINLLPYDTKRNEQETVDIVNLPELRSIDLIVGPLYPGPSKVVSQFSFENRVNMINPLSTNSEVIGNNPYSFLFKPSTETQARTAANYAKANVDNKAAVIIYEDNPRDSLFAHIYKAEIEKDSFQVVWFRKFTEENAREFIDVLTELYESDIPADKVDSLQALGDYPMELRRKQNPYDPDEYYEELLVIPPDSIGHVLTASNKVVFAANSLSMVNIRGDSIALIGREEWLNYTSIGFDQMEQLDVSLISPSFYDENTAAYRVLRRKVIEEYKSAPNQYHVIGYELMRFIGQTLSKHGKYFQTGIRDGEIVIGKILEGVQYGHSNDNQLVPIVKFEDAQLKIINHEELIGNE